MWTFIKNSQNIQTSKAQITRRWKQAWLCVILESLRYHDGDVNEKIKKTIGWIGKKRTLHMHRSFLYIFFLLSLYDYDMKLPNFTLVYGGRKQATLEFSLSLSLSKRILLLGIRLQESSPVFDNLSELK